MTGWTLASSSVAAATTSTAGSFGGIEAAIITGVFTVAAAIGAQWYAGRRRKRLDGDEMKLSKQVTDLYDEQHREDIETMSRQAKRITALEAELDRKRRA